MDGVPRFSETGPTGIPIGVAGEWTEPPRSSRWTTTSWPVQPTFVFAGISEPVAESVELEFTDPGGYFPPQTVPGASVASCN